MSGQGDGVAGLRFLVVGASSGIGHAVAVSAAERGAEVAVAPRRIDLLTALAETVGGSAFELDVEDTSAINRVVGEAAKALGGIDAVVFTSTVVPFAHIEDTDVATWIHAFTVNTVGANNVLRAATDGTEILRGVDCDLLAQLFQSWVEHGQLPAQMSALRDVANTLVSLIGMSFANPSVVPEVVQLSPRVLKTSS